MLPLFFLFAQRQKQSIAYVPQAWDYHALVIYPVVHRAHPHFNSPSADFLDLRRSLDAVLAADSADHEHLLNAPLKQRLNCGDGGATGGNDRIEQNGYRRRRNGRGVRRQVIVVLNRGEGDGITKEAEVMHGGRGGQESL